MVAVGTVGYSNNLSWSVTRSASLRGCLRAHWFDRYSRGEPEEFVAKQLSKLVSLEMLAGQVVDWQVNSAIDRLRDGEDLDENIALTGVRVWKRMLTTSMTQVEKMKNSKSLPFGAQPLQRDYYHIPCVEDEEMGMERVRAALEGFGASELLSTLRNTKPSRWKPQASQGKISAEPWTLDGKQLWSSLDFWIDYGDKGLVVIDWKSSSKSGRYEWLQLAVYSLYGQTVYGLDREQVLVQAAHLPLSPKWEPIPISEHDCSEAKSLITKESSFEQGLLEVVVDKDGVSSYFAPKEEFTPEPSMRCVRCRFREICPEGTEYLIQHRLQSTGHPR